GQSATWAFPWAGGAGHLVADAATPPELNLKPSLRIDLDGTLLRQTVVAGPIARPAWAPFDVPQGTHTVRFTAIGGTLLVSGAGVSTSVPPTSFTGAAARVH